jgi:DNA-binding transcriptional ArsR family regulator
MVPNRKTRAALRHPRNSQAQGQAVFRALADPTRRRILGLLRVSVHSVGELAGQFPMSRPAISKHLRLLRSAGLVVSHRRGTARICALNAQPLRAVNEWLRDYQRFWEGSLRRLKQFVEENP